MNDLQEVWSKFFSLGLRSWLDFNLSSRDMSSKCPNWLVVFGVPVRELWLDRNQLVFNGKSSFPDAIWSVIAGQVVSICRELNNPILIFIEESLREVSIVWNAPSENYFKVNVDGSYR